MQPKAPIGVFDSGIGGLTIMGEFLKHLPEYDYIYLGDNARTPYGTRSFEVVYQYTLQSVKKLFDMGCPLVILACNTASAKALRTIQQNDLPKLAPNNRVLGVIRPTTEYAGEITKTKHVGVFATSGTVKSDSYKIEINKFHPEIEVYQEACPLWVPLVENNEHTTEGGQFFIKKHVDNLLAQCADIDAIILGCTHYPVLYDEIKKHLPQGVNLISQGEIVANSLKDYLQRHPEMEVRLSKHSQREFYTTEDATNFDDKANIFMDFSIRSKKLIL
ncbi:MAG: glutamate racemase [Bacteroidia bacterium]